MNTRLNEKASQESLDRPSNTIGSFVERLDDSEIDQASRDYQYERLLTWARQVSKKKIGIPIKDL